MFLKHRDLLAWILILLAAISVVFGQMMLTKGNGWVDAVDYTEATVEASHNPDDPLYETEWEDAQWETPDLPAPAEDSNALGIVLCVLASVLAVAAVVFPRQRKPLFGPDGAMLLMGAASWGLYFRFTVFYEYQELWIMDWSDYFSGNMGTTTSILLGILTFSFLLAAIRELWGWMLAKLRLDWCLVSRVIRKIERSQLALMLYFVWILTAFALVAVAAMFSAALPSVLPYPAVCAAVSAVFPVLCLWKYGSDLNHFRQQLKHYEQGQPIAVREGSFADTERQLSRMQKRHEEAIRTAVTGERFKVELISNVSHDLRTPLTSILGYSELLHNETLSPDGQEQLRRLHQKAGYMNDLVESLFELTKVSSGVVESKKDKIDLVRLMEQTIGLFDDQLVSAGLVVKRSYCADTIPAITDGARMHQVFANLLGNAIKYALAGTRIYLEVRETHSSYLIRMMNTASYEMDFKPDEIMQRFARGDKARSTKGSGLGLAIAQTYTESVGGSFRVSVDGDQFSAIVELPKN